MDGYGRLLALAVAVVVAACAAGTRNGAAAAWGWQQPPLAPCMYIFGDSLVDNGNNNNILSLARANYRPYGIDFHEGPPGRFTNGRTMVDFLADMLRLRPPLLPPYATASPDDLPRGVNFASGASGVLPETGNNLGGHYPLSEQVDHFRAAVGDMGNTSEFRGNAAKLAAHLGRCIFFVGMGSNDYLNNYFMPDYYDTARRYSPRDYAALLLQGYAAQLAQLYGLGARKFVVAGVGLIGCIPYELARMNDDDRPSGPSNQSLASEDLAISIGLGGGGGGGGDGGSGLGIGIGLGDGRSPSMPLPYTDGGYGSSGGGGNGYGNGSGSGNGNGSSGGGGNGNSNSNGNHSSGNRNGSSSGNGNGSSSGNGNRNGSGNGSSSGNGNGNGSGGGNGNGTGTGTSTGTTNPTTPDAGVCNETINSAIDIYNRGLLAMVKRFNRGGPQQLPGAKFVFLNTVQTGKDLAANAAAHGFTVLDRGCCGVGRNNGQITCLPLQRPCDDRSKYMFWDAFHPTEAAHRIYAARAFGSNSTAEVYPINVSQLAAI